MKLSTLRIIASYMIPERISSDEFKRIISKSYMSRDQLRASGDRSRIFNQPHCSNNNDQNKSVELCERMVEQGMKERAQRIVQTRKTLMNIDDEFYAELVGIVIVYAFGMCQKQ